MIKSVLAKNVFNSVACPVTYCRAEKGEYCKTPGGNTCGDLHKRRYGKYVREVYNKTGRFSIF